MQRTKLETQSEQQAKVTSAADASIYSQWVCPNAGRPVETLRTQIQHEQERPFAHQGRTGFRARTLLTLTVVCLGTAATAYGQSTDPWSTAAGQLSTAFTGPIAKGFALVAIVLGGLQLAFSEGGHSRVMGGLIFGVGLALGAATFLSWITT